MATALARLALGPLHVPGAQGSKIKTEENGVFFVLGFETKRRTTIFGVPSKQTNTNGLMQGLYTKRPRIAVQKASNWSDWRKLTNCSNACLTMPTLALSNIEPDSGSCQRQMAYQYSELQQCTDRETCDLELAILHFPNGVSFSLNPVNQP